jgi:probable F420-dependent oxidoreductase
MRFGVCIPNYGESATVDGLRTVALEAEKLGYDSVWTTDHVLMPPNSGTPYERIFESITTLAYLAAITSTVKLGVSSLITPMRNPAVVVKQLATIDQFSQGRVMLVTSSGWYEKEFQHLGSNFHDRGKRLDESIKLIRALWSDPSPRFEGKIIPNKFSEVVFEPRPIQRHLTIWIGGVSKAAMRRAAMLGDAWHPNVAPMDKFRKMVEDFRSIPQAELKEICVRIGLDIRATKSDYTGPQGDRRLILSGNMDLNKRIISDLAALGVTQMILAPNFDGKATIPTQVESLTAFAESEIRGSEYIA